MSSSVTTAGASGAAGTTSCAGVCVATVDAGVLAIALLSLAIRLPFTLQYAREAVDPEVTLLPGFLRANIAFGLQRPDLSEGLRAEMKRYLGE